MHQVIIEVFLDSVDIIDFLHRNTEYYNHKFANTIDQGVYVEAFHNGIMLINQHEGILQKMHQFQKIFTINDELLNSTSLKQYDKARFPKHGLNIEAKITGMDTITFYQMLKQILNLIHPDFQIELKTKEIIAVVCPNYEAFASFIINILEKFGELFRLNEIEV